MKPRYTVAVYIEDLCYGGPEEGGWYFHAGEPAREHASYTRRFSSREKAHQYRDSLDSLIIPTLNEDRRPMSSVLSDGEYRAYVSDGPTAQPFPTHIPHYC